MTSKSKCWLYLIWIVLIFSFAILHGIHLQADFPNRPPMYFDGAMYTDEGWWASAAIRAHLNGSWYPRLDYNPAPAVPVLPFLEWALFFVTGATINAVRGMAVAFFFLDLFLVYLLVRRSGPKWVAMLAVTLLVTNPFLYSFSRVAILEPIVNTLSLAALYLATKLIQSRKPVGLSIVIGVLCALMLLTKTSAVCLMPAVAWAMIFPIRRNHRSAVVCFLTAALSCTVAYGLWILFIERMGFIRDFWQFFSVNSFNTPTDIRSTIRMFIGVLATGWRVDRILIAMSVVLVIGTILAWRIQWSRRLMNDPLFGASTLAIVGNIIFMTYHYYAPPRYFEVVAIYCFLLIALTLGALFGDCKFKIQIRRDGSSSGMHIPTSHNPSMTCIVGSILSFIVGLALSINGVRTLEYVANPQYTFVNAARQLTQFIDSNPNGNRILVSISGDQISLVTGLQTLCAPGAGGPCGQIPEAASKLAFYQPGWYAEWNVADPDTLEVIHQHFSIEQVASFSAFDDPVRDRLVLFKLHPLPHGEVRSPTEQNLKVALAGDRINVSIAPSP